MLKELLNEQLRITGFTRDKLANEIGSRPTQVGYLLADGKEDVTLSITQFEKMLDVLGIRVDYYLNRVKLAKEIAGSLVDRRKKVEEVARWNRAQFVEETGRKEVEGLPEFNIEQWKTLYENNLVDLNGSFPVFSALVQKYMKVFETGRRNATPTTAKNADEEILKIQQEAVNRKKNLIKDFIKAENDPLIGETFSDMSSKSLIAAGGMLLVTATLSLLNLSRKVKDL